MQVCALRNEIGIVALGLIHAIGESRLGELAFGIGVVFLIVGRVELFNENLFDPVAKAAFRAAGVAL